MSRHPDALATKLLLDFFLHLFPFFCNCYTFSWDDFLWSFFLQYFSSLWIQKYEGEQNKIVHQIYAEKKFFVHFLDMHMSVMEIIMQYIYINFRFYKLSATTVSIVVIMPTVIRIIFTTSGRNYGFVLCLDNIIPNAWCNCLDNCFFMGNVNLKPYFFSCWRHFLSISFKDPDENWQFGVKFQVYIPLRKGFFPRVEYSSWTSAWLKRILKNFFIFLSCQKLDTLESRLGILIV